MNWLIDQIAEFVQDDIGGKIVRLTALGAFICVAVLLVTNLD